MELGTAIMQLLTFLSSVVQIEMFSGDACKLRANSGKAFLHCVNRRVKFAFKQWVRVIYAMIFRS